MRTHAIFGAVGFIALASTTGCNSRRAARAEAKERAARFFERQVSMIPGASVATRTADAIERNLGAS